MLVVNTVVGHCRRCRTYINPYVQFMDSGNWVSLAHSPLLDPMSDTMQLAVLHVLYVEWGILNSSTGIKFVISLGTAGHMRTWS